MTRTIARKMNVQPGSRTYLRDAPEGLLVHIGAVDIHASNSLEGNFRYIHLFATSQRVLTAQFSELRQHLAIDGALWVSWPKGGQLGTDLNLHEVIRIGYSLGLVESTCLSIDKTWSALRFTHPKPGKVYNNSHAVLKTDLY